MHCTNANENQNERDAQNVFSGKIDVYSFWHFHILSIQLEPSDEICQRQIHNTKHSTIESLAIDTRAHCSGRIKQFEVSFHGAIKMDESLGKKLFAHFTFFTVFFSRSICGN